RTRAACPFPGWRNREALGDGKPLGGIDCSVIIREWGKLGCGSRIFYVTGADRARFGEKQKFLWTYDLEAGRCRRRARRRCSASPISPRLRPRPPPCPLAVRHRPSP